LGLMDITPARTCEAGRGPNDGGGGPGSGSSQHPPRPYTGRAAAADGPPPDAHRAGQPPTHCGTEVPPGAGTDTGPLGDDRPCVAGRSTLRHSPPLHAPFDQDRAAVAERGLDVSAWRPNASTSITADVLHAKCPPGGGESARQAHTAPTAMPFRGRPDLGVLEHSPRKLHAMQRGHMVVSCGAPLGETCAEATIRGRVALSDGVPAGACGPSQRRRGLRGWAPVPGGPATGTTAGSALPWRIVNKCARSARNRRDGSPSMQGVLTGRKNPHDNNPPRPHREVAGVT